MNIITSKDNEFVKHVKKIKRKKFWLYSIRTYS